jgi:hypothetical protein
MDVRGLQRPLKDRYRQYRATSRITVTARAGETDGQRLIYFLNPRAKLGNTVTDWLTCCKRVGFHNCRR